MRVLGALVASLALFAGLTLAAAMTPHEGDVAVSVLAVPPGGEVVAVLLDDGEPVFVVAHRAIDGGGVSVVPAINSHLDIPVVWCASDRTFWEPGPASRFDEEGTYLVGPAPRGLATFDAEVVDERGRRLVHVGARRPAVGREVPGLAPVGSECEWEGEDKGDGRFVERLPDGEGHDLAALYGPPVAPEEADRWSRRWGRFRGRISTDADGRAVVCSRWPEAGCPRPSTPVVSLLTEDDRTVLDGVTCVGDVDGEILAEVTPAGFVDAVVMPPFTDVSKALSGPGEGYMAFPTQVCEADDEDAWERSTITGTLVAVSPAEGEPGTWVAVFDERVQPRAQDAYQAPLSGVEPSARWPFRARALLTDYQAFGVAVDPSGRRLPKSTYLPAELPALLADRGPQQVWVSLDGGGRIIWGELGGGG